MLTVLLWGVLLGGVVYSHLVFFPVFLSNLPESSVVVSGPYGMKDAPFWMTIHPLLILSLTVSLISNWRDRARRLLIAVPLIIYVLMIVITTVYFLPELAAFEQSPSGGVSATEWATRANRWIYLSWMRGMILFACAVPLLLALTRSGSPNDER